MGPASESSVEPSAELSAELSADPPVRRRLKLWRIVLIVLAVLMIVHAVRLGWLNFQLRRELARIEASGYPMSPAELDAWHPQPAGENAAPAYARAFSAHRVDDKLTDALPPFDDGHWPAADELLPRALDRRAGRYLRMNAEAMAHLRVAARIEQCRFPLDLAQGASVNLPHLKPLRDATRLQRVRAEVAADEGEAATYVEAVDALLATGDALADEPHKMSYRVRLILYSSAVEALERGLGQLDLTEAQLAQLQRRLPDTTDRDALVRAFAGKRVIDYASFKEARARMNGMMRAMLGMSGIGATDRLAYLRLMRLSIEAARRPGHERRALAAIAESLDGAGDRHQDLVLLQHMLDADREWRAMMRTTEVMLAVRRHQLAHGRPPADLDALVPTYLDRVPTDPYNGEPVQYRHVKDREARKGRLVIYCVGEAKNTPRAVVSAKAPPEDIVRVLAP